MLNTSLQPETVYYSICLFPPQHHSLPPCCDLRSTPPSLLQSCTLRWRPHTFALRAKLKVTAHSVGFWSSTDTHSARPFNQSDNGWVRRWGEHHMLWPTTLFQFTLVLVVGCKWGSGRIVNAHYSRAIWPQPICVPQEPVSSSSLICFWYMSCAPITVPGNKATAHPSTNVFMTLKFGKQIIYIRELMHY